MRAVRFADECSKYRAPGKFFFLRPPADPPGPLRVLPRRGAQRQEAREGPHRFQWK